MNQHDREIPEELGPLARSLTELGDRARREGESVAGRVAMRTSHLFREAPADDLPVRPLQRLLLWLAGPSTVLGAVVIGIVLLRAGPSSRPNRSPSVETVATNLEHEIDAWLELDAAWRRDSFDNELALLALEAAGVAVRDDDLPSLSTTDTDS